MLFESLAELIRFRGFRHFRQGSQNLLLGVIHILQGIQEKIIEGFLLRRHGDLLTGNSHQLISLPPVPEPCPASWRSPQSPDNRPYGQERVHAFQCRRVEAGNAAVQEQGIGAAQVIAEQSGERAERDRIV